MAGAFWHMNEGLEVPVDSDWILVPNNIPAKDIYGPQCEIK